MISKIDKFKLCKFRKSNAIVHSTQIFFAHKSCNVLGISSESIRFKDHFNGPLIHQFRTRVLICLQSFKVRSLCRDKWRKPRFVTISSHYAY